MAQALITINTVARSNPPNGTALVVGSTLSWTGRCSTARILGMARPVIQDRDEHFDRSYQVSEGGCWIWQRGLNSDGYGQFWTGTKNVRAHKHMYEKVVGPVPSQKILRHICHNRSCVNPQHLLIGAPKDNSQDMVSAGRQARGEYNGNCRYTTLQVAAARQLHNDGWSTQLLAALLQVDRKWAERVVAHRGRL